MHCAPHPSAENAYGWGTRQCPSYKIGQLKFRELRARAQKELGPKFDLRTFHDEMLSAGPMPLDLLDVRTNAWIAALKAGAKR